MSVVLCDYQRQMEEEKEDKAEMSRLAMQVHNRQVAKRRWFTLYEKMAAVWQIQQNIEVGDLSIRVACRVANLHHKQFIIWKSDISWMQKKSNKHSKSMCLGPSSIIHPFEEQLLHHMFELQEQEMAAIKIGCYRGIIFVQVWLREGIRCTVLFFAMIY